MEKSVYVCGRFTLVGRFTFDGVTKPLLIKQVDYSINLRSLIAGSGRKTDRLQILKILITSELMVGLTSCKVRRVVRESGFPVPSAGRRLLVILIPYRGRKGGWHATICYYNP